MRNTIILLALSFFTSCGIASAQPVFQERMLSELRQVPQVEVMEVRGVEVTVVIPKDSYGSTEGWEVCMVMQRYANVDNFNANIKILKFYALGPNGYFQFYFNYNCYIGLM